jgi:hypothetical protein
MKRSAWVFTAILVQATLLEAQAYKSVARGDRVFGASAGASFYTPNGAHFAEIRDRNLFLTSLRAEWVLETVGPMAVASTVELVPLAVISRRAGPLRDCWRAINGKNRCQAAQSEPALGTGIVPFGFKLYLLNQPRARLFANAGTGLMMFSHEVPVGGSRRLNFTVEYGAGVEAATVRGSSIVVGWKFHHMSNAYTAPQNPGVDVNLLYVGLLHRRR